MITFKQYIEFLVEDRIEFLKKKYKNLPHEHEYGDDILKSPESIIDFFSRRSDPTPNKKYLDWILKLYSKHDFRQEDFYRVREALTNFERYKSRMQFKDINHYQNLSDLEDAIEAVNGAKSKREEIKDVKHDGADKIFDRGGVTVYKIKTEAAAKFYGKGTKWCTAAEHNNMFKTYDRQGPLYIIFIKQSDGNIFKYQFHFESNQFMDAKDSTIFLNSLVKRFPVLKDVPAFQGKKVCLTNDANFKNMDTTLLSNDGVMLIRDPRLTTKQIDTIVTGGISMPFVAEILSKHPNMTSDIIKKLMQNRNVEIRSHAICSPKATVDILLDALKDSSNQVRENISLNSNITPEILIKLMDDKYYSVRESVMNSNVKIPIPDQVFEKAINDKNDNVRLAAIKQKDIPLKYVREVTDNDKNSTLRAIAAKILEKRRLF